MALKERFCRVSFHGSTHQALLLQIVEKGGSRRKPRLPVARETVLITLAALLLLLVAVLTAGALL